MARRKRLEMPTEPVALELETKSAISVPRSRMPISDVAGDISGRAALEEIAREMTAAEAEGRVIRKIALDDLRLDHLSRDRLALDDAEMGTLRASIAERGQQTPIEVVALSDGGYGLISGLRRVAALRELGEGSALALVKRPETSRDAYRAMVDENEVRANLSFYERANIAVAAAGQGVYPDVRAAVMGLFVHAPKAKRSKILKFVTICETLGAVLRFPERIPEHLGFKLAQAIEDDPKLARRISSSLAAAAPEEAASERRILEAALKKPVSGQKGRALGPGLRLEAAAGRVVLSGKAVDAGFIAELEAWAASREG